MKIILKELELISACSKKECEICDIIIKHIGIDYKGNRHISTKWLEKHLVIREHLKQIIRR